MNGPFVMNIRPILLIVGSNVTFQYTRHRICGYYDLSYVMLFYHYFTTRPPHGVLVVKRTRC
jgi:hypothetical protein